MQMVADSPADIFSLATMAQHPLVAPVAQRQATLLAKQRKAQEELTAAVQAMRAAGTAGLRKAQIRVEEIQDALATLHADLVVVTEERESCEREARGILGPQFRAEGRRRLAAVIQAMEVLQTEQDGLQGLIDHGARLSMAVPARQAIDPMVPQRLSILRGLLDAWGKDYND